MDEQRGRKRGKRGKSGPDGRFVYILKPDRLRYWLRSIALRDADEIMADLRSQGY